MPDNAHVPPLPAPPPAGATCNAYLPSGSTLQRFLWVVGFYAANGFYVLVDNHWLEDDTVLAGPAAWAGMWAELVRRPVLECPVRTAAHLHGYNTTGSAAIIHPRTTAHARFYAPPLCLHGHL